MRIGGSKEGHFGQSGHSPRQPDAQRKTAGRALTVVAAAVPHAMASTRGDAAFLAQLIATKEQAPQTRMRRRAEPAEALAAYHAAASLKA